MMGFQVKMYKNRKTFRYIHTYKYCAQKYAENSN